MAVAPQQDNASPTTKTAKERREEHNKELEVLT